MGIEVAVTYKDQDNSPFYARIAVESIAACLAALSVSPAISIVDKAIVSNAAGTEALLPALWNGCKTLITKPFYFIKQPSFIFILGVYSGTYIVGNSVDAICEREKRDAFYPKFFASSIANVTLSVLKDKAFARMFGKGTPRPLPVMSYGLFATRDSLTILAGFSLPGIISNYVQESWMAKGKGRFQCTTCYSMFDADSIYTYASPWSRFIQQSR